MVKPQDINYENKSNVSEAFKKGVGAVIINNLHSETSESILQKTKQVIKPLVKDEELLNIILQDSNLEKIKHRFVYNVKIFDNKDNVTTKISIFGKTPLDVLNKLKEGFTPNEFIEATRDGQNETVLRLKSLNLDSEQVTSYAKKGYTLKRISVDMMFKMSR